MILDLASPIRAGDQVEVTLSLSDGSTTSFTALAKAITGGEENYEPGAAGGTGPRRMSERAGGPVSQRLGAVPTERGGGVR
jgi:hypothetical protein